VKDKDKFAGKYRVQSARLPGWNYSSPGYYFVTICTRNSSSYFGEVVAEKVELSEIGICARRFWIEIPEHFSNISLDEYVVMPNHVHGIFVIQEPEKTVETLHATSLHERQGSMSNIFPKPGSLSAIVRSYKSAVTRWVRKNGYSSFAWQPRFYDHIIRNDESLDEIRRYIRNNPLEWDLDKDHPKNNKGNPV
jgi:putative transposase